MTREQAMPSDTESDRQREAMAMLFAHLACLLPPAGQPLPENRRREFLAVVERALDYLYADAPPDAPEGGDR